MSTALAGLMWAWIRLAVEASRAARWAQGLQIYARDRSGLRRSTARAHSHVNGNVNPSQNPRALSTAACSGRRRTRNDSALTPGIGAKMSQTLPAMRTVAAGSAGGWALSRASCSQRWRSGLVGR